jgi:hypothetical protein
MIKPPLPPRLASINRSQLVLHTIDVEHLIDEDHSCAINLGGGRVIEFESVPRRDCGRRRTATVFATRFLRSLLFEVDPLLS